MCLRCAIPVRGGTVGSECLAIVLGPDAPTPAAPRRDVAGMIRTWQRLVAGVAVVATLLPWSRFGAGSGPFGAWSDSFRWSMVAAVASVAAFLLSLVRDARRSSSRSWDVALAVAAGLIVVGSVLAVARPPAFTSPWLGPWIAASAGVIVFGTVSFVRRDVAARTAANV
jgi:hypothetical protein